MTAPADVEGRQQRTRKKKKAKKDKWGQPVPTPSDEVVAKHGRHDGEEEEEDAAAAEGVAPLDGGHVAFGDEFESRKLVVSGMPYSTTERQIWDLFADVGPIAQLQLSRFPDTGNFRGLAFITFETEESATYALDFDGTKLGGRFIKVERCRIDSRRKRKHEFDGEPVKVDGCLSAYIGNLSWDVTEDDIRDCFGESNISSIRFAFDRNTGKSRGFCHIDFEDDDSLEKAMIKNQMEFRGRPMRIAYAVSNK